MVKTISIESLKKNDMFSDMKEVTLETFGAMCKEFNITVDGLAGKWDAYTLANKIEEPTNEAISGFKTFLKNERSQFVQKKQKTPEITRTNLNAVKALYNEIGIEDVNFKPPSPPRMQSKRKSIEANLENTTPNKREKQNSSPIHSQSSQNFNSNPSTPIVSIIDTDKIYSERPNSKSIIGDVFNESLGVGVPQPERELIDIANEADINCTQSYRHMNEELYIKADHLDNRLQQIRLLIAKQHKIKYFADHHLPRQEEVIVCGRICLEVEGKIDAHNIVLEARAAGIPPNNDEEDENDEKNEEKPLSDEEIEAAMMRDEGGTLRRVRLSLIDVEKYSLFPGQIVACRGTNPTGRLFEVSELFTPAMPPSPPLSSMKSSLRVLCAAGPFTTAQSTEFLPLIDVIQRASQLSVETLILIGPLIPSSHTLLKPESVHPHAQPDYTVWRTNLRQALSTAPETLRIVVLPSLDDIDAHLTFPQPPLDPIGLKNVVCLSNPSTFAMNGVSIGAVAEDIIRRMTANTVHVGEENKFTAVCRQLLAQQSYYPLFPSGGGSGSGINISLSQAQHFSLPFAPNIVFVGSDLKQFITAVDNTVFINVGRLARARHGGAVAFVVVHQSEDDNVTAVTQTYARLEHI